LVTDGEYSRFTIAELQLLRYLEDLWNFFAQFNSFYLFIYLFIYSTLFRETYKGVLRNPNWAKLV